MSTEVTVTILPHCDFCGPGSTAQYDAKTITGPWANLCEMHYQRYKFFSELGTGKGQRLVVKP